MARRSAAPACWLPSTAGGLARRVGDRRQRPSLARPAEIEGFGLVEVVPDLGLEDGERAGIEGDVRRGGEQGERGGRVRGGVEGEQELGLVGVIGHDGERAGADARHLDGPPLPGVERPGERVMGHRPAVGRLQRRDGERPAADVLQGHGSRPGAADEAQVEGGRVRRQRGGRQVLPVPGPLVGQPVVRAGPEADDRPRAAAFERRAIMGGVYRSRRSGGAGGVSVGPGASGGDPRLDVGQRPDTDLGQEHGVQGAEQRRPPPARWRGSARFESMETSPMRVPRTPLARLMERSERRAASAGCRPRPRARRPGRGSPRPRRPGECVAAANRRVGTTTMSTDGGSMNACRPAFVHIPIRNRPRPRAKSSVLMGSSSGGAPGKRCARPQSGGAAWGGHFNPFRRGQAGLGRGQAGVA